MKPFREKKTIIFNGKDSLIDKLPYKKPPLTTKLSEQIKINQIKGVKAEYSNYQKRF